MKLHKKTLVGVATVLGLAAVVIYFWDLIRLVKWSLYIGAALLLGWATGRWGFLIWIVAPLAVGLIVLIWWWRKRGIGVLRGQPKDTSRKFSS